MSIIRLTLLTIMSFLMFISTIGMGGCGDKNKLGIKDLSLYFDEEDEEDEEINTPVVKLTLDEKSFSDNVITRLNEIFKEVKKNPNFQKKSTKKHKLEEIMKEIQAQYPICSTAGSEIIVNIYPSSKNVVPYLRFSNYESMIPWKVKDGMHKDAKTLLENLDKLKEGDDYVYAVNSAANNKDIKLSVLPEVFEKLQASLSFRTNAGAWISDDVKNKGEGINIAANSKELDKFLCDRIQNTSPFYEVTKDYDDQGSSDLYFSDNRVDSSKKQKIAVGLEYRQDYDALSYKMLYKTKNGKEVMKDGKKVPKKTVFRVGRTATNKFIAGAARKKLSNGKYRVLIYFRGNFSKK